MHELNLEVASKYSSSIAEHVSVLGSQLYKKAHDSDFPATSHAHHVHHADTAIEATGLPTDSTHFPGSTTSASDSTIQRGSSGLDITSSSNTNTTVTNGAPNSLGAISGALAAVAISMVAAALVVAGLLLYRKHRATRHRVPTGEAELDLGKFGDKQ